MRNFELSLKLLQCNANYELFQLHFFKADFILLLTDLFPPFVYFDFCLEGRTNSGVFGHTFLHVRYRHQLLLVTIQVSGLCLP